LKKKTVGNFRV